MKSLVIYDSQFGNTEKIARAIGQALEVETKVVRPNETNAAEVQSARLLIVGSPTQGGRATLSVQNLINSIPALGLQNIKVAAFDTRFEAKNHGLFIRLLVKTIGYAAEKISKMLANKGGQMAVTPEAFFVMDKKGPLKEGELERAAEWAKKLV
ncbi:MAG: flavodoxin domain-containing protein [Patescibacteria group bacterium]|jgi:flavodoxin